MTCSNKFSSLNGRECTYEEQMAEPMNTLTVSASHPTGKDHCNDLKNNEICISIIIKHLYLYKFICFCR